MNTQSRIIMNVIITSGYKIKGRRPNLSTTFIDAIVAIRLIIPVEIIPQYTLSSTKPIIENV
jgi:hypothetical protein